MEGFLDFVEREFHLTNLIIDRQNPTSGDTVSYSVYVIDKTSVLTDLPHWGAALDERQEL
jgi:hypothetical protein